MDNNKQSQSSGYTQSQSKGQEAKETLANNRTDPDAQQELSTPMSVSEIISSLP